MPQPIDPNTEVGRMSMAERIQEMSGRLSLAAQARHAAVAAEAQVRAESQVDQAHEKSEQVDEPLERHNPYLGRRNRGRGQQRRKSPHTTEGDEHKLDISI